jgi:8-oxo-dGTP pyrophosphatase MutT (NUDIX family)
MPTRLISGDRVGRRGKLRIGCSAVIFDEAHERVLLTRRTDNNLWCLPGGAMDAGESAAEACVREVLEETGMQVRIVRLVGVYSSPHWLIEYPDGNRVQIISLCFEAAPTGGDPDPAALSTNHEVNQFGFFTLAEAQALEMMENHKLRILDAFSGQKEAFIR